MVHSGKLAQLLQFLQQDLQLSDQSLELALRQLETEESHYLPMILWHYGLISLPQLDQVFDWLERYSLS